MSTIQWDTFSEVAEYYIFSRKYNKQQVFRMVNHEFEKIASTDTYVEKFPYSTCCSYLNGTRKPDAEFVLLFVRALKLTTAEKECLIDAMVGDYIICLHNEFQNAQRMLDNLEN